MSDYQEAIAIGRAINATRDPAEMRRLIGRRRLVRAASTSRRPCSNSRPGPRPGLRGPVQHRDPLTPSKWQGPWGAGNSPRAHTQGNHHDSITHSDPVPPAPRLSPGRGRRDRLPARSPLLQPHDLPHRGSRGRPRHARRLDDRAGGRGGHEEAFTAALPEVPFDSPAWDAEDAFLDAELLATDRHPWPVPTVGDDDRMIPPDAVLVPPELEDFDAWDARQAGVMAEACACRPAPSSSPRSTSPPPRTGPTSPMADGGRGQAAQPASDRRRGPRARAGPGGPLLGRVAAGDP